MNFLYNEPKIDSLESSLERALSGYCNAYGQGDDIQTIILFLILLNQGGLDLFV